jgi:hypothetical protein
MIPDAQDGPCAAACQRSQIDPAPPCTIALPHPWLQQTSITLSGRERIMCFRQVRSFQFSELGHLFDQSEMTLKVLPSVVLSRDQ